MNIPRSYALVIGVSRYQYLPEGSQLKYATADAAGIYTALIDPEGGQFPAENVHRLIGPNATLANMRHEIEEWLPSVSKADDRVLIYFAGHGIAWQDGKAYLAPYDVKKEDVGHTAYPMDRLGEVFGAKIKARWRVLLTDACHSGALLPATDPQTLNNGLKEISLSVFSLTASRAREVSYESSEWGGGHGAFTYYVMKGLEGEADANRDGQVTADEISDYVYNNVRRATTGRRSRDGTLLPTQNPTSTGPGQWDPNMLLAYNPTRQPIESPEGPQFGTLVIEANMDGTEVFLDGKSQGLVNKGKPLRLPGITPGIHKIEGVRMPYVPFGPAEETVSPGQTTTVTIRLTLIKHASQPATEVFERGLVYYTNGNRSNYEKAAKSFERAFALDPSFSRAALYLARTYNALNDNARAEVFFRKAIDIDPDYQEARDSYAGTLIEKGDFQGAIRQLNSVVQRDSGDGMAHYMLSVAFTRIAANDKTNPNAFEQGVKEGRESVRLLPNKGEAHFWLAESLRMSGKWDEARTEYLEYLKLTNFDSRVAGQLNYYVLGYLIGMGHKTRASQHDIWVDQRDLAYFGLCDSERLLGNVDAAISYCQRSLAYDPQDAFAHLVLGRLFVQKYNVLQQMSWLLAARTHFQLAIKLIPNTEESEETKRNIERVDAELVHYASP